MKTVAAGAKTEAQLDPRAAIRVGIGGWTYAPWRGSFYPDGLVQRRELEYASRKLTAIEINGTFYGAQKPATYAKWAAETPDGFVFSLKAPRYITGRKRLATASDSIAAFVGDLGSFGDRLGPILWQFDDHHRFDPNDFSAFLALLPKKLDGQPLRHVLEVRHASFQCREYIELARHHQWPTVFTDSPEHPSFADLTGDFVYLRLMNAKASLTSGYTRTQLARWAERTRLWAGGSEPDDLPRVLPASAESKPRDVFVYFINGAKERAPQAAMAMIGQLAKAPAQRRPSRS